jgi:hypothetical protein
MLDGRLHKLRELPDIPTKAAGDKSCPVHNSGRDGIDRAIHTTTGCTLGLHPIAAGG